VRIHAGFMLHCLSTKTCEFLRITSIPMVMTVQIRNLSQPFACQKMVGSASIHACLRKIRRIRKAAQRIALPMRSEQRRQWSGRMLKPPASSIGAHGSCDGDGPRLRLMLWPPGWEGATSVPTTE